MIPPEGYCIGAYLKMREGIFQWENNMNHIPSWP
jgi:hypothetical protein